MNVKLQSRRLRSLFHSRVALALPVTFLILLVSALIIVAATYTFAVERVNSQGQTLKVSNAKGTFQSLNDLVISTLWQPGSAGTIEIPDCNGQTNIQPTNNTLTISINDGSTIDETIFNAAVGQVTYELPYSNSPDTGTYLTGDSRSITNQSGSSMSQLCIVKGAEHVEIQLRYRPTVSVAGGGVQDGKAVNNIRIYIVNMNGSDAMALMGRLPLRVTCMDTQLTSKIYAVGYQPENLVITANLDGALGSITLPLSSTSEGSVINLEIVVSNIAIQRWIR